jgi:hypothetical protein
LSGLRKQEWAVWHAAHARAGQGKPLTLGHPEFEGFESVLELLPKGQAA